MGCWLRVIDITASFRIGSSAVTLDCCGITIRQYTVDTALHHYYKLQIIRTSKIMLITKISMCIFGVLIIPVIIYAGEPEKPDTESIKFKWAFVSTKQTLLNGQIEPITRDTFLKTGDKIKFFIKLQNKCHVYLIYHSSQGEISVLFPYRFKMVIDEQTLEANHFIPKGNHWFELDEHKGEERFYLIASAIRLLELESYINEYESSDAAKKSKIAEKILAEVRKLRKKHLTLKTEAERPVTILGNLRGTDPMVNSGIVKYALDISANTFYSRTFTIDHQ